MSNFRKFFILSVALAPVFVLGLSGCENKASNDVTIPTTFAPPATEDPPLTMAGPGGGGNTGGADKGEVLPMKTQ